MRTFNLSLFKLVAIILGTIVITTVVNVIVLNPTSPTPTVSSQEGKSLVQGELPDLTRNRRNLSDAIEKAQPTEATE